jgi:hypothetical protein
VGLGGFFIFSANAGCLRMEAHRRFYLIVLRA